MRVAERAFLISGGSSGLGAACAHRLVAAGASVVIADMNVALGQQVAKQLGGAARFVETNVTDSGSVERAVQRKRGRQCMHDHSAAIDRSAAILSGDSVAL